MDDAECFFDLMGNPKVMNPIPLPECTREQSELKLKELILNQEQPGEKKIWAVSLKYEKELIALCGLLINNDNEPELAYRIREKYWSNGYGTEIAEGLISYCFTHLQKELITADVWLENPKSMAILNKFMTPKNDFYNEEFQCHDRRFVLYKKDWLKTQN